MSGDMGVCRGCVSLCVFATSTGGRRLCDVSSVLYGSSIMSCPRLKSHRDGNGNAKRFCIVCVAPTLSTAAGFH